MFTFWSRIIFQKLRLNNIHEKVYAPLAIKLTRVTRIGVELAEKSVLFSYLQY